MPRVKNTVPSPFFVVSLFVARLRWCHGSRGGAAITTVNNPAHSIAVLNCGGNATDPNWAVPYRTEPCRTVPYHAVEKRHYSVLCISMLIRVSFCWLNNIFFEFWPMKWSKSVTFEGLSGSRCCIKFFNRGYYEPLFRDTAIHSQPTR